MSIVIRSLSVLRLDLLYILLQLPAFLRLGTLRPSRIAIRLRLLCSGLRKGVAKLLMMVGVKLLGESRGLRISTERTPVHTRL